MSTSASISPFVQPGAPPPPVVVLLDVTELYIAPAASLLAFEDLQTGPSVDGAADRARPIHNRYHPYHQEARSSSSTSSSTRNDQPCLDMNAPLHRADSSPLSSAPSSPRSSPSPRSNEARPPTTISAKIKIERPKGAGRKNVLSQVKWEETLLSEVKAQARALIFTELNPALCFKDQNERKLKDVKNQMVAKFPILDNYENMWPLDIIIMSLLKYYSAHGKDTSTKKVVNNMREVIGPASISSRTRRSKAV